MTAWTSEERARAIGLGMTVGAVKAAEQTGIPRRTISHWLASPEAVPIREQTRHDVERKLWDAVSVGVDEVLAGLRDPKARLSDKARALEVVAQQHALLTGGVTARTETVTDGMTEEEERALRDWVDSIAAASDDDIRAYLEAHGVRELSAIRAGEQREMAQLTGGPDNGVG